MYLDELISAQNSVERFEQSQREHFEQVLFLRRQEAAESELRVDRYADEQVAGGPLTGDAAERRLEQRQADHLALYTAYQSRERAAEDELSPIQARVAREMNITMQEAVKIAQNHPGVASATQHVFATRVAAARSEQRRARREKKMTEEGR